MLRIRKVVRFEPLNHGIDVAIDEYRIPDSFRSGQRQHVVIGILERLDRQIAVVPLNGGPEYLSWVIESKDKDFKPETCAEWLEGRLPRPVGKLKLWKFENED